MSSDFMNKYFKDIFNFICPLCNQQYDQAENSPMMLCFRQHVCCQKCLNQKVFKNQYINIEMGQCPQCKETIKRSQITKLKLYNQIMNFKKGIIDQNESKIQEQRIENPIKRDQEDNGYVKMKNLEGWLLDEAQSYFLESKFEKTIRICRSIIDNNPVLSVNFKGFGSKEDFIGYQQEYIKQYYRKYMKQTKDRSPCDLLSLTLLLGSDYDEDKQWFLGQIKKVSSNYQLWFGIGVLEANCAHYDDAIRSLQTASMLNSKFDKAEQVMAFQHYAQGDHGAARLSAAASLLKNPQNIYSLYMMAMTTEDEEYKIELLLNLAKNSPQYLVPLHELGQIYFTRDEIDQAISCYQKCLQISPIYDFARISLGLCYLENDKPTKVVELFENHQMIIEDEETYQILAEAYCKLKLTAQAYKAVQKCKAINPQNSKIKYILAGVYEIDQEYELAIQTYKQLLDQDKEDSKIYKLIALAFLKKKDFFNAEEWNEQYMQFQPEDTSVLIQLANYYFQENILQQALRFYLQCFEINRQFVMFAAKIIQIYQHKHLFEEALFWAKKWNDAEPTNPESWEVVSSVSKTIGDKIRAKQWEPKKIRHTK